MPPRRTAAPRTPRRVARRRRGGEGLEAPSGIVAIVGRPNVGKSTLFNRLAGERRAMVAALPGTTRDAVDTVVAHAGGTVRLVDTAGLRPRGGHGGDRQGAVEGRRQDL